MSKEPDHIEFANMFADMVDALSAKNRGEVTPPKPIEAPQETDETELRLLNKFRTNMNRLNQEWSKPPIATMQEDQEFANSCTKCFQYTNDPLPHCTFCEEDTLVTREVPACTLCGWPKSIGCHHPDSQCEPKPAPRAETRTEYKETHFLNEILKAAAVTGE